MTKKSTDDYLVTALDVARILNVHPVTVHRLRKNSDFPRPIWVKSNKMSWWNSQILEYMKHKAAQLAARQ